MKPMSKPPVQPVWMPSSPEQDSRQNCRNFAEGYDVALAPIVSSTKSANVILKFWDKKYHRTADFLVIEGPLAGGHLGFSREQLEDIPGLDYDTEIRNIITLKQTYEEKYQTAIPGICRRRYVHCRRCKTCPGNSVPMAFRLPHVS